MKEGSVKGSPEKVRGTLSLFLAAVIWGSAFVAQSVGGEYVGTFTFNASRFFLGALVLLPVIAVRQRRSAKTREACEEIACGSGREKREDVVSVSEQKKREEESRGLERKTSARGGLAADSASVARERKTLVRGGLACGVVICVAANVQQLGIQYTTVGKAGFITAMYIILVPIFSIFLGKKPGIKLWISVLIALWGLYLLCMSGSFSVSRGDLIVFLCAVGFAVHILVIDYFSPKTDGVKMSCIQFSVAAALSAIFALLFESPSVSALKEAWMPIAYAGVLSSGVAYTLQIVGQKDLNPTVASLIMSLESVVSVIAGWLILGQTMGAREIAGCALMFAAIILAQLPQKNASYE